MRLALAVLFAITAIAPACAVEQPKSSDAGKLRQGIAKGWEILKESRPPIEVQCKAEAKKRYYAVFFRKRRMFVKDCIERASRKS